MSRETAFGGSVSYSQFKKTGQEIGGAADALAVREWVEELNSNDPLSVQRASAVCYAICDENPELFRPHLTALIEVIEKRTHDAGPRLSFKVLNELKLPDNLKGRVIDLSFKALSTTNSSIAISVFALSVIGNHLDEYPDLKVELSAVLRDIMINASAGLINRANKLIRQYHLDV
jgi:hypothetical protein